MVLTPPKGQRTRPTADRIKENLFNIISPYVQGARFLDLFCGSGAIGIEALSRGADKSVFVDISPEAVRATKANLERTRLLARGEVLRMCCLGAVSLLTRDGREFDIVYLDPPYGQGLLEQALSALGKSSILSPKSIIIAEGDKDEKPPAEPLMLQDVREYGSTKLMIYTSKSPLTKSSTDTNAQFMETI